LEDAEILKMVLDINTEDAPFVSNLFGERNLQSMISSCLFRLKSIVIILPY